MTVSILQVFLLWGFRGLMTFLFLGWSFCALANPIIGGVYERVQSRRFGTSWLYLIVVCRAILLLYFLLNQFILLGSDADLMPSGGELYRKDLM